MLTGVDLVQTQIALAAGEPLSPALLDTEAPTGEQGWAMLCRVRAEDPWRGYMASPGRVHHVRFPDGPGVRVDSYLYGGADIPAVYDPLIAKLAVWGQDREQCLARLRYALEDFIITGAVNNVPRLQEIVNSTDFAAGRYDSDFPIHSLNGREHPTTYYQDLAVMAAVLYQQRLAAVDGEPPVRLRSGWHRSSRQLAG
jgi:acetyl/propionyl-CoA carboxylase alpha subunit